MKPIERLKTPVSDIDCIKAIDVVISILDQVITAGLKGQITEVWLTVIESKVVRYDKMDHYMEKRFKSMRVVRDEDQAAVGEVEGESTAAVAAGTDIGIQNRREVVQRKFCCINCLKDNKFVKHNKLSDCRAKNCAICNGIHHILVCLEPTG